MKRGKAYLWYRVGAVALMCLFWLGRALSVQCAAQVSGEGTRAQIGAGTTIVHSQFGGQIFGFDIDQNGTEGVLSEVQDIGGGKVLAAVETFDQVSGKILKVVKKIETKDDFLTLGIVGTSVGLVEREHVQGIYVKKRIYELLNPIDSNEFTSTWSAPLASDDIILGISRDQASTTTAVLAFENDGDDHTFVFSSNVGANTFGSFITLTDPVFFFSDSPVIAYDSVTNQAVVAASTGAVGGPPPVFALVDLTSGKITEFNGL